MEAAGVLTKGKCTSPPLLSFMRLQNKILLVARAN